MPAVNVESFFHGPTNTFTHVVWDHQSGETAIVDPVLDFSVVSGRTGTAAADELLDFVRREGLQVVWILETHAHADHVSAGDYLKARTGAPVAIGAGIASVQRTFSRVFNLDAELACDGSQFDRLFRDGDEFAIGELTVEVMATPGHTDDSISYLVAGQAVFVGDTLFRPDYGSARCDFPGGDAGRLYDSVRRLFELPGDTRIYLCHDYPAAGSEPVATTTVAEQRAANVHLRDGVTRDDFVALRDERDATLGLPALIIPAIQMNIRAGRPPAPEGNGVHYLKIPLDSFPGARK